MSPVTFTYQNQLTCPWTVGRLKHSSILHWVQLSQDLFSHSYTSSWHIASWVPHLKCQSRTGQGQSLLTCSLWGRNNHDTPESFQSSAADTPAISCCSRQISPILSVSSESVLPWIESSQQVNHCLLHCQWVHAFSTNLVGSTRSAWPRYVLTLLQLVGESWSGTPMPGGGGGPGPPPLCQLFNATFAPWQ